MDILIGCDPEVFVKQDNKFLSAFNLIRGNKEAPQPVRNGAVQVDGMALEFNIIPAVNSKDFLFKVTDVLAQLKAMVPAYQVVAVPVADFDPAYLLQQPREALELGCNPDYNAWMREENPRPDGERPFRTASGHIHIGWRKPLPEEEMGYAEYEEACEVGVQMDFFLGLGSLFYDADTKRREMYGRAGCIRIKPYGVEYRTLSNVWLNSPALTEWVYSQAVLGTQQFFDGNRLAEKYGDIQEIINTSNKKAAMKIIKDAKLILPPNV